MPHSQCGNYDLYNDYATVRGPGLALENTDLLPIKPLPGTQPCGVFGLNPVMRNLQRLYNQGDAAMLANVGTLVEPIKDKQEYKEKTKQVPPSLFAHNTQQLVVANVHAQNAGAKGVVGEYLLERARTVRPRRRDLLVRYLWGNNLRDSSRFASSIMHNHAYLLCFTSIDSHLPICTHSRPYRGVFGSRRHHMALQNFSVLASRQPENNGRRYCTSFCVSHEWY